MEKFLTQGLSLNQVPFFHSVGEQVRIRIEDYVYQRQYEPRQVVYFPDDNCDHVYWVRSGMVKITRVAADRREFTFRLLFPGDMLGEESLVSKNKRGAYAEAMAPTVLYLMRVDDFRRVTREEGEVSLILAQLLAQRVIDTEHVLAETVFNSVRSRVAAGLVRLCQRMPGRQPQLKITHQEIANLVGTVRETTTIVLHEFRDQGMLNINNRRITVLDTAALERVARRG